MVKAQTKMQMDAESTKQKIQLEREKAEADFVLEQQKMQFEFEMESRRLEQELQIARSKAAIDVHVEEQKSRAQIESNKSAPISQQAEGYQELAVALSHLGEMSKTMSTQLEQMNQHTRAPKRVVRDPQTNRVVGVESVMN